MEAANDTRHMQDDSQVQSAFIADLSDQVCWTSPQVRLWASGHTHYNCDFMNEQPEKRVVANQKGYRRTEAVTFDATKVVRIETAFHLIGKESRISVADTMTISRLRHCTVS